MNGITHITTCPFCGEETEVRFIAWSEEVLGRYCEKCNKSCDYETGKWEDGELGCEFAWYGTGEWDLDLDEEDD